jgi:hypothetical protein
MFDYLTTQASQSLWLWRDRIQIKYYKQGLAVRNQPSIHKGFRITNSE